MLFDLNICRCIPASSNQDWGIGAPMHRHDVGSGARIRKCYQQTYVIKKMNMQDTSEEMSNSGGSNVRSPTVLLLLLDKIIVRICSILTTADQQYERSFMYFLSDNRTKIADGEKCPFHLYLSWLFLYRIRSVYARLSFCTNWAAAVAAVP